MRVRRLRWIWPHFPMCTAQCSALSMAREFAKPRAFASIGPGAIVAAISPSFGEFFKHEGAVIQSDNFAVSESPLKISVEATARLAQIARKTESR